MKIAVTGSNGQVGKELQLAFSNDKKLDVVYYDKASLDITNSLKLNKEFAANKFDVCINAAAYTAVDKAEDDYDTAFDVNAQGAENIARVCELFKTKLIHISTDFVFDGQKQAPYLENDKTNPLSAYGETKLVGEERVLKVLPSSVVIRTSWVYSHFGNNFVKTMKRLTSERDELNVVNDQIGNPTYAADLAQVIKQITLSKEMEGVSGIFHYSNKGNISWYQFALAINDICKHNCAISPIPTTDYPTPATRPPYSVMNTSKIESKLGIAIYPWKKSLEICLEKLSGNEL